MKKQKGITLIALVITIIVLLILAGTTIKLLSNENGVISKAEEAAIKTMFSQIAEHYQLYIAEKTIENSNFNKGTLNAYEEPNSLSYNTKTEEGGDIYSIFPSNFKKNLKGFEITNGVLFYGNSDTRMEEFAQDCGISINPYEISDEGVLLSATVNRDLLEGVTGILTIPTTIRGITVVEVGEGAFGRLEGVEHIVLPNTVKVIKKQAFRGNTSIKKVTLPNGLETIGEYAFAYCTSLQSIVIPNTVTKIEQYAFRSCTALEDVTLSNGLTELDKGIFLTNTSLKQIELPSGVTKIGERVFEGCTELTTIKIPASVTRIASNFASGSKKIQQIIIDPNNSSFKFKEGVLLSADGKNMQLILDAALIDGGTTFKIPDGVEKFEVSPSTTSLTKVIIPNSVKTITAAFSGTYVDTIELINAVGQVVEANDNFSYKNGQLCNLDRTILYYCALRNNEVIQIDEGIKTIDQGAFVTCRYAKEVKLPESLKAVRYSGFSGLVRLTVPLKLGKNVTDLASRAFDPNINYLVEIDELNSKYILENSAIYIKDTNGQKEELLQLLKNDSMTSFKIADEVKKIGSWAFGYRTNLKSITIPNGIITIGENAFSYCSNIETLDIPSSVITIEKNAFLNCDQIRKITIHKAKNSIAGSPWGLDIGNAGIEWMK